MSTRKNRIKRIAQLDPSETASKGRFSTAVTKIIEGTEELENILHDDWNDPGLQEGYPSNWNIPLDELSQQLTEYRDRHSNGSMADESDPNQMELPIQANRRDRLKKMAQMGGKEVDMNSLEVDGINTRDAPDFSDAFIAAGNYTDGTPLDEAKLEELNDDSDLVHQLVEDDLY